MIITERVTEPVIIYIERRILPWFAISCFDYVLLLFLKDRIGLAPNVLVHFQSGLKAHIECQ